MIISTFTLTFKITHLKKTPLSFSKFYVLIIIIILLNIYIEEGNHALRGVRPVVQSIFFSDVRIPTHPSYCTKISLFLVFLVSSDHRTKQQMLHSNRARQKFKEGLVIVRKLIKINVLKTPFHLKIYTFCNLKIGENFFR